MSNLLSKASIVLTPTAYSDGDLHCIKPNTATGDFDLTRSTTATRENSSGNIESVAANLPRIDYLGGTAHILLEPQSTNKLTQSETFSTWENIFVLLTSTNIVAPDGSNSVIKMSSSNLVTREHKIAIDTDTNSATDTIFAKMGEVRYIYNRRKQDITSWQSVVFDLQNGVVSANNYSSGVYAKMTDYGDGWYRCEVNYSNPINAQTGWGLSDGSAGVIAPANTTDGVYIWGAQQEDLSFATSYIPTTSSTVTRSADVCNNSGSSDLINSTEGVLYAEIAALGDTTDVRGITLSDGSSNNRIYIHFSSDTNIRGQIRVGASNQAVMNSTQTLTNLNKIALKYKANDFALWINGVEVGTDTSGNTYSSNTLTELSFDDGGGGNDFYGKVKSVAVFKEALTDAQLQCLTS